MLLGRVLQTEPDRWLFEVASTEGDARELGISGSHWIDKVGCTLSLAARDGLHRLLAPRATLERLARDSDPTTAAEVHADPTVRDFAGRADELSRLARDLARERPPWTVAYRRLLGPGGAAWRLFPTAADRQRLANSEVLAAVITVIAELMDGGPPDEPIRVITPRIPASLHSRLKAEAATAQITLNRLATLKLLRPL